MACVRRDTGSPSILNTTFIYLITIRNTLLKTTLTTTFTIIKMKFSTIFAVASAIAINTVTAAPAPVAEAIANPVKDLEERANNGANCKYSAYWTHNEFKVITWGPWAQDGSYGRGLLDNLRGQCGVITNWEYRHRSDGAGIATFKTITINSPKCAKDAIWLASGPTNVVLTCTLN
ncbi:hypothetical protein TWF173_001040 [Orbilia oligospora]|nr:hypothetical protein TWF173_001040 [Orbilia oligospora]